MSPKRTILPIIYPKPVSIEKQVGPGKILLIDQVTMKLEEIFLVQIKEQIFLKKEPI